MPPPPYSNRELEHHFKDTTETLARILEQTTATNGKIREAEKAITEHDVLDLQRFSEINIDTAVMRTKLSAIEKLVWVVMTTTVGGLAAQFFNLI